jgi:hypothetical protein
MYIIEYLLEKIVELVLMALAIAAFVVVMAPLFLLGVALIPCVKVYEFLNEGWSSHNEYLRKRIKPLLEQAKRDHDQKSWRTERGRLGYCRECLGAKTATHCTSIQVCYSYQGVYTALECPRCNGTSREP